MNSKNHYHPVIDHVLPSEMEEPVRKKTGSEIGADMHGDCFCMPIKYWILVLALIHVVVVAISLSLKFYFIFDTILIVFSVLIVLCPDTFHVFVHFIIQLVFWIIISICYISLFIREVKNDAKISELILLLTFFSSALFFTVIYIRLLVASR